MASTDYTWSGTKDWSAGLVPETDFDTYFSGDVGFVYYNQTPMFFVATDALFPTGASTNNLPASSTDIESSGGPRMSVVKLAYEAAVTNHAAQWNFRSWFASSDVSGIKFQGFMDNTLIAGATDGFSFFADIASVSDGDASINTKAFSLGAGGLGGRNLYRVSSGPTIDSDDGDRVVPNPAYELFEYSLVVADTNTWDGVAAGDMCILSIARGSITDTGNLYITRAWIY